MSMFFRNPFNRSPIRAMANQIAYGLQDWFGTSGRMQKKFDRDMAVITARVKRAYAAGMVPSGDMLTDHCRIGLETVVVRAAPPPVRPTIPEIKKPTLPCSGADHKVVPKVSRHPIAAIKFAPKRRPAVIKANGGLRGSTATRWK